MSGLDPINELDVFTRAPKSESFTKQYIIKQKSDFDSFISDVPISKRIIQDLLKREDYYALTYPLVVNHRHYGKGKQWFSHMPKRCFISFPQTYSGDSEEKEEEAPGSVQRPTQPPQPKTEQKTKESIS